MKKIKFTKKTITIGALALLALIVAALGIVYFTLNENFNAGAEGTGFVTTSTSKSQYNIDTEQVKFAWAIAALSDVTVNVRNTDGSLIQTLYTSTGQTGGDSLCWDGTLTGGSKIAPGNYILQVKAYYVPGTTTFSEASSNITITNNGSGGGDPVVTDGEYGFTLEGSSRMNINMNSRKVGISFINTKAGTTKEMGILVNRLVKEPIANGTYGAGNLGTYKIEIQTNGANNFPSGSVVASVSGVKALSCQGYDDLLFESMCIFPFQANLEANKIYHIVITNTDSSPDANFVSLNTLMSPLRPWDDKLTDGPRAILYYDNAWHNYSATLSNPWNTTGRPDVNGSHVSMLLRWQDGSKTGDPYQSTYMSTPPLLAPNSPVGEYIHWDKPNTTISTVGLPVRGTNQSGSISFTLEKVGGSVIATGTATPVASPAGSTWFYGKTKVNGVEQSVQLVQGSDYRLKFGSAFNSYTVNANYTMGQPIDMAQLSYGGTASYLIRGTTYAADTRSDLTFSMK